MVKSMSKKVLNHLRGLVYDTAKAYAMLSMGLKRFCNNEVH